MLRGMTEYVSRSVDALLEGYVAELPAVMVVGPRACGKTTTALRLAESVVRLDTDQAAAFRASPDAALRGRPEPVLLDEWQMVPEVLSAVKRAVDTERRPGRFLVTGSHRTDPSDRFWPGTGRVVMVHMQPLTVAEQIGEPSNCFVDRLAAGQAPGRVSDPGLDLRHYVGMALRGGFPEPALQLGEHAARAWLEGYADQIVLREARLHGKSPDAVRLQRYLHSCALSSGAATHHKKLYDTAGVNRKTAVSYDTLLHDLLVIDLLPAWSTNRLKRLSRTPKRYIVDSGLLAGILRVGTDDVMASSALLGSIIDTFVVAQLRAEATTSYTRYRLSHLREQDGRREIDVIAELGGGRIIGIEIRSAASVLPRDARHLKWLSQTMGDRFIAGTVLHTGPDTYQLADRIYAAPISSLWDQPAPIRHEGVAGVPSTR